MDAMLYVDGESLSDTDNFEDTKQSEIVDLKPCAICSRTFTPSALEKHVGICEKMHLQKRGVFDSFRQRREGTELETYLPSNNFGLSVRQKSIRKPRTDTRAIPKSISGDSLAKSLTHNRVSPGISDYGRTRTKETSPIEHATLKRSLGPINEVCPHCGRSFGVKAYDRHVDWCKEKTKLTNPTLSAQQHLAKQRMQARTKYKAPSLRSKREKNREKYSSMSESMNNLSESGGISVMDFSSVVDPYERNRKFSTMSLSMTSSVASDGGKYDPFMSAKRQFEDLFSPPTATLTPNKDQKTSPIATSTPLKAESPSSPTKNPYLSKSSFRRTSSLRMPKKTTPVSYMPKYKPTIQRGISDEGPISSNFMKPEEYDELPVKNHSVIPPDLVPESAKTLSRDVSVTSPKVLRRQLSPSENRRPLHIKDFQLTKTDSLAAFLKFEDDLEGEKQGVDDKLITVKDLKDKSNSLNKKMVSEPTDYKKEYAKNEFEISAEEESKTRLRNSLLKLASMERCNSDIGIDNNDNLIDSNLINSCDNSKLSHVSDMENEPSRMSPVLRKDSTSIDATLENSSAIKPSDLIYSEMPRNSSADSVSPHQNVELIVNLRKTKRQYPLRKDSLLFDHTSANNNNNDEHEISLYLDENSCQDQYHKDKNQKEECPPKNSIFSKSKLPIHNIESLFDDFDLEEFISTFSDNEQFPIFKSYKEMNGIKKIDEQSTEAPSKESDVGEKSNKHEEKLRQFDEHVLLKKPDITVEAEERLRAASKPTSQTVDENKLPAHIKHCSMQELFGDDDIDDGMTQAERELLVSVQELNDMCDNTKTLDLTAGLTKLNARYPARMEPINQNLFHQSPLEKSRNTSLPYYRGPESIVMSKIQTSPRTAPSSEFTPAERDLNSVSSPAPISLNEILPPIVLHKNDSKNIYNMINMSMSTNGNTRGRNLSSVHVPSIQTTPKFSNQKVLSPISSASISHPTNDFGSSETPPKQLKFCHECGAKFIIDKAKFCMECGVQRIYLD